MPIELGTTSQFSRKISFLVWGEPGVGKTSLAKTLPVKDDSRVLYVAADPGQLALRDRNFICAKVSGPSFLRDIYTHIRDNQDKYDWVFFDGLNEAGETVIKAERAKESVKASPNHFAPYNKLDEVFHDWTIAMLELKPHMIFVTHRDFDSKRDKCYLPLFPGNKFTDRLLGIFDEVGYMRLVPEKDGKSARRVIQFGPEYDARCEVKDRSGALLAIEEPDIGSIFRKIYGNHEGE